MAAPRTTRSLAVVALAAGRGKRLKSTRPKVLHEVAGRPSLWFVLQAASGARPRKICVVVGYGREQIEEAVRSWRLPCEPEFVQQEQQLGTGHAVMVCEEAVAGVDDILVVAGDDPLITQEHVRELLKVHRRRKAAATILTTELANPRGFGRVIRDGDELVDIVQEVDASPSVRRIREVSTLVYAFRREDLFNALPLVGRENKQHEYYLPDVIHILKDKGELVAAVSVDLGGGLGLNTRNGLSTVGRILRERIVQRHLDAGVSFVDPATAYVDVDVRIGTDTVIQPMTILQGSTRIGSGCVIGPGSRIVDSIVADGAEVAFSVVRGSKIGRGATVGPYASLRPGTVLEENAKAGTFVEIKASRVGRGSKVPHLSYVGDATLGDDVNIGAGTVTVNYDGFEKHRTTIGSGARVGSDTMLIAPLKVGKRAWTGAGSAITRDVPDGALAVERSEQRVVPGYDERKRSRHAASGGGGHEGKGKRGRG